jgi:hypothetical protein
MRLGSGYSGSPWRWRPGGLWFQLSLEKFRFDSFLHEVIFLPLVIHVVANIKQMEKRISLYYYLFVLC